MFGPGGSFLQNTDDIGDVEMIEALNWQQRNKHGAFGTGRDPKTGEYNPVFDDGSAGKKYVAPKQTVETDVSLTAEYDRKTWFGKWMGPKKPKPSFGLGEDFEDEDDPEFEEWDEEWEKRRIAEKAAKYESFGNDPDLDQYVNDENFAGFEDVEMSRILPGPPTQGHIVLEQWLYDLSLIHISEPTRPY